MPNNRNREEVITEGIDPLHSHDFCSIEAVRIDNDGRFYFELPNGGRHYLYGREDGTE